MKLNTYQERALLTAKDNIKTNLSYLALGLCGESGEVAEHFKKEIRDGKLDKEKVKAELGDIAWYLAVLSNALGFTLEDVAVRNLEKLFDRKQRDVISGSGDER